MNRINRIVFVVFFLFVYRFTFSLDLSFVRGNLDEKLGKFSVTFDELVASPDKYENQEISFSGFVWFGSRISMFKSLESLITNNNGYGGIHIYPSFSSKFDGLNGCYVTINGKFIKEHKNRNLYALSDISLVARSGKFYFASLEKMESKGIKGQPRCLGDVFVTLMSEP